VVIKGENHHVLEALQFTHAGKVDCIYFLRHLGELDSGRLSLDEARCAGRVVAPMPQTLAS
jgi:hypothetical protein